MVDERSSSPGAVPTSFVWIADNELRIFSIIVVGFSLVIVSIMLLLVRTSGLVKVDGFFDASFKMAEFSVVPAAIGVEAVAFGAAVVDIIVIELIILSIIDIGFSVVPSFTLRYKEREKKKLSNQTFLIFYEILMVRLV